MKWFAPSPVALALALASCKQPSPRSGAIESMPTVPAPGPPGPFDADSPLPFGMPPFDRITDADFAPAFEAAMAVQRIEVRAIADNPEPPTFENTVLALERSSLVLARVAKVFDNLVSSHSDDALLALDEALAPERAAQVDSIVLDPALFARVDAVYRQRDSLGLDPESAQLLIRYEDWFVHSGARLSDADRARLAEINGQLSTLATRFDQNVLAATRDGAVVVDDVARLAGLSPERISAAAQAAAEQGLEGKWVLTLQNTTVQPVLGQIEDRSLRERVYRASIGRADGGDHDNRPVVSETMKLRAEKAALLGYPTYAAYALTEETAGTPEAVDRMLRDLLAAALIRAKEEAAAIQKTIDAEARRSGTARFDLQPWDWAFYAEKVRKRDFDFDEAAIKPYFELDRVLKDGVFFAANQLYGITFEERHDLPVYEPTVRVFEVKNADGSSIGLFLFDGYARDGKEGGAWMENFVDQSELFHHDPVVVNNLNIPQPASGQPTLLTFDEVDTAFHEMGHALHGLFSSVQYPLLSGTNTPPDFAEYPSQINEMWATDPAILANYAKHYQTGEPLPKEQLDKVIAATRFNQGYDTLEYLEAALVDQAWHAIPADQVPSADQVMAFEAAALKRAGVDYAPVPPRYHTPYFSHTFNGEYAAGYYAYIWSEVLARDTGAQFAAHGGATRANGDAFRQGVLSRGRTEEPSVLFEALNGGPPTVEPLLEWRGLTLPQKR